MSGDSGNGGDKGGAGDAAQQLADANAKISELTSTNETLSGAKESAERQLGEANKELLGEEYMTYLEGKGKPAQGDKGGTGSAIGGEEFDRATNTEVAKMVMTHVDGKLTEINENFGKTQKAVNDKIGLAFAQLDVSMTRSKYDGKDGNPSWTDHSKEIFDIAGKNPTWGAEQCYKQFKLEFDASAKTKADADAAKAKDEERLITEKGGVAGSTTQEKDLTPEQAADLAYRQSFGNKAD